MGFQVNITKGDLPPVGAAQDDLFIKQSDGTIYYFNGTMFVPIGAPPTGAAGGDLGGTFPSPTVLGLTHVTGTGLAQAVGGTGATGPAYTTHGVLIQDAGFFKTLAVGSTGQHLAGSTGADPTWANDTLNLIGDTTLGASATNITFSAIPGTYKHLQLVIQARSDAAAVSDLVLFQFNGDTGSNYDTQRLTVVNATQTISQSNARTTGIAGFAAAASAAQATAAGTVKILIPNYAGTTFEKGATADGGFVDSTAANSSSEQDVNNWRSTAAITSIKLFPNAGTNFVAGTRATLYGLA